MKKELYKIASAIMFFTRIPLNIDIPNWEKYINSSQRYFPLVGWIVGAVAAISFWASAYVLPNEIAILISMIVSILLTGAFHEDGFGDICDGFGGGYTPEKILDIMKDSRMGAYGVIGICLMLLLKYTSLSNIDTQITAICIITGHTTSRVFSINILAFLNYARIDETSKSKPIAKTISKTDFVIASLIGLSSMLLFDSYFFFLSLILPLIGTIWFARYFNKKIGGYTGDCLGAVQQLAEVLFYIGIIMVVNLSTNI